jgi:hypothetical protein
VPRPRFEQDDRNVGALAAAMRRQGETIRRDHAIDALLAADPTLPADEFLDALEQRGLLSPPEEASGND